RKTLTRFQVKKKLSLSAIPRPPARPFKTPQINELLGPSVSLERSYGLPMTDEPGRGIGFQRQVSLDGARVRSSSEDDRETKDTAVEQPGTGTLFRGRQRRRPVCHPGTPGSPPVDRPEPEAVWLQAIAPRRAWTHCAFPVQGQRLLPS